MPLYNPFAQNDFIRYIISNICGIYIRLNGIDQSIVDINNQITDILVRVTNLENNQFSFPSVVVNNCLTGGTDLTIETFPNWINYVNSAVEKICNIINIVGDVTEGINYTFSCSQLGIENVSVQSLREFIHFFATTIFPNLCNKLAQIDTSITNINTQIDSISNELATCGCGCLDYIPVSIIYKPISGSLNNYNIIIGSDPSVTITSVSVVHSSYNDCNIHEVVTPTISGEAPNVNVAFSSCGTVSTCNSDPYYTVVVSIDYIYSGKTCNYKQELKIKSYTCVCGNVQRIFMTEKDSPTINIMTRT